MHPRSLINSDITYMVVLISPKNLDLRQVSADSEMLTLGQAPNG
jgi:hypothetical protein